MRPEIGAPDEFVSMHRMNIIKLKGDYQLEADTFTYPPYYEYILELCDSRLVLKGSSICDPMLDQVFRAVEQQSYHRIKVNVKIKSISYSKEIQMKQKVEIIFQIESLDDY